MYNRIELFLQPSVMLTRIHYGAVGCIFFASCLTLMYLLLHANLHLLAIGLVLVIIGASIIVLYQLYTHKFFFQKYRVWVYQNGRWLSGPTLGLVCPVESLTVYRRIWFWVHLSYIIEGQSFTEWIVPDRLVSNQPAAQDSYRQFLVQLKYEAEQVEPTQH